jgi:general secretion pathway protein G
VQNPPLQLPPNHAHGFSLIELVIVIVILGIIAAIAAPRFSRGSQSASEAALQSDLRELRAAIDLYYLDHGDWPAYRAAAGDAPHASSAAFERQLTWYTAADGQAQRTPDDTHPYGPYLEAIPPLPVGKNAGLRSVQSVNSIDPTDAPSTTYTFGWQYCHYSGYIRPYTKPDEIGNNGVSYYEW